MDMRLWPLVLTILALVYGCASSNRSEATSPPGNTPIQFHLVCLAGADGQTVTCESAERLAHLNTWLREAMSRPYSGFWVWAIGPDRSRTRLFFAVCIPPKWGPGVFEAKAAFIAAAQQGVSGHQAGLRVPERCGPPGSQTPALQRLEVSPAVAPLPGDIWHHVVAASGAAPLHFHVLCDRSDSTGGLACNTTTLLSAFDRWVTDGLALPGASFAVTLVGSSWDTGRAVYHLRVPEASVGERVAGILGARAELKLTQLLPEALEKNASAVAEAMSRAAEELRAHHGRYQLLVLSDLRQVTTGVWNFEQQTMPSAERFIAWLKAQKLLANLQDIPVVACGLHSGGSPRAKGQLKTTATLAVQLRELWENVLRAEGAPQVQIFTTCAAVFTAA